ncbi:MAG: hypothetical protein ACJ74H_01015 [Thermoanaerobaculia bacterium]
MILVSLLLALAVPLSASQFIEMPFDQVAREAKYAVRGQVTDLWSAWDTSHEVIYTYATVRVSRYFGEATGPDTLVVREVGGTVDGYTQEAIGFPAIRRGENVVLFLSEWDDSTDLRIHAFNQGKYLVQIRAGKEILVADPVKQGDARFVSDERRSISNEGAALGIEEFAAMVDAARAGRITADVHQARD